MSRKRKYEEVREMKFPIDKLLESIMTIYNDIDIANIITGYAKPRIISFSSCFGGRAIVLDDNTARIVRGIDVTTLTMVRQIAIDTITNKLITGDNKPRYNGKSLETPVGTLQVFLDDSDVEFAFVTETEIIFPEFRVKWKYGPVSSISWSVDNIAVMAGGKIYSYDREFHYLESVADMKYVQGVNAQLLCNGTVMLKRQPINVKEKVVKILLTDFFLLMLTETRVLWALNVTDTIIRRIGKEVCDIFASFEEAVALIDGTYWRICLRTKNRDAIH